MPDPLHGSSDEPPDGHGQRPAGRRPFGRGKLILTTAVAGLLATVVFTVPAVQAAPDPDAEAPPTTSAEPIPESTPDAGAEPAPAPSPDAAAAPAPDADAQVPPAADAAPTPDAAAAGGRCHFYSSGADYGFCIRHWNGPENAQASIVVRRYNRSKRVSICDYSRSHTIGLAIMIDPSGPRAPITYWDQNGAGNSQCFRHTIGYSVRKWKFVSVHQSDGRLHDASLPWQRFPLPRPDY